MNMSGYPVGGKDILIGAMGNRLPESLLKMPKKGFGVPLARWFRTSLRDFLQDHLTSRRFLDRGIVSPEFLAYLLDEHTSGRRNLYAPLWSLLVLALWYRGLGEAPVAATAAEGVVLGKPG